MKENWPYHLCFETLSNDLRLRILKRLREHPYSVSELCKDLKEEQSKVSHSLSMLRLCNYVQVSQEGKRRVYSINPMAAEGLKTSSNATVFDIIDQHVMSCCNFECKKLQSH